MLISKKPLIYVSATRNTGVSNKTNKEYDMATIEVSDGIASLDLPLNPQKHGDIVMTLQRGDSIDVEVDVQKQFGRANFIVSNVTKIATK